MKVSQLFKYIKYTLKKSQIWEMALIKKPIFAKFDIFVKLKKYFFHTNLYLLQSIPEFKTVSIISLINSKKFI